MGVTEYARGIPSQSAPLAIFFFFFDVCGRCTLHLSLLVLLPAKNNNNNSNEDIPSNASINTSLFLQHQLCFFFLFVGLCQSCTPPAEGVFFFSKCVIRSVRKREKGFC